MRKLTFIIVLVCIICSGKIFSQEKSNSSLNYSSKTNFNHYIKISPFNLLEIEPSLMLGYSYPVKKGKAQWQHEIGYVFLNESYFFSRGDINRTYNGVKFRTNYRTYFESSLGKADSLKNPNNRLYFGVDMMYKYGQYTENEVEYWVMGGQYTQLVNVTTVKHVGAAHFMMGAETNFIKNSNAILDFYLGIGLRYKYLNVLYDGVENSIMENNLGQNYSLWYDDPDLPMFVSIMAGMKIGFGL
ncbi:MAG: hypothetical protein K9J13_10895 [Saprospiraceae bacterium]|nr:hypothetical protein [Saprospiraceae bacterium]